MSEIRANTVSNAAGTGPATLTGQYAAKTWIQLNGIGTIAINDSENVSSITDVTTGTYGINYTNAFVNGYYSVSGSVALSARIFAPRNASSIQTTNVVVDTYDFTGGLADMPAVSATCHGALA